MKKFIFCLMAMVMCLTASAHKFDGIDLNDNAVKVLREVSVKGYTYDNDKQCLKGNCQGTEIFLSFNLNDVKTPGKVGQLIIDVPGIKSVDTATTIFNVIYHQTAKNGNTVTYLVDEDGTTMTLTTTTEGVRLTYNTIYYAVKK